MADWALVTGAARRTGSEIAVDLAAAGYNLHLHAYQSQAQLRGLAEELEERHGVSVRSYVADFAEVDEVQRLQDEIRTHGGLPSLIVNNAAVFDDRDDLMTAGIDVQRIDLFLRINTLAPIGLANLLVKGVGGLIVNILDARAQKPDPHRFYYHLSKDALGAATRLLATALAPAVRVNAIAPGLLLPPADRDESYLLRRALESPLRVPARVSDLVAALTFLRHATSVTGEVIYVDSGEHL